MIRNVRLFEWLIFLKETQNVIIDNRLVGKRNLQKMQITLFVQFAFFEYVADVS